jgi:hypothetical protein
MAILKTHNIEAARPSHSSVKRSEERIGAFLKLPGGILLRVLLLTPVVYLLAAVSAAAAEESPTEYEVKAAYLYNFAKFVEWPKAVLPNASKEIVIGILGEDPFGKDIETVIGDKTVGDNKIVIKRSKEVDELKSSHILFISKSEKGRIVEILDSLKENPTLTVGDTEGFAETGGMVGFYFADKKIRFEVNNDVVKKAKLEISSKLLNLARIVKTKPKGKD